MKNSCLIFFLIVMSNFSLKGQIHHFEIGKTLSQYNYTNSLGIKNKNITSLTGNRLGLFFRTKKERSVFGFSYQEQNARGGNGSQIYLWETQYLGIQLKQLFPLNDKLQFALSFGTMFLLDGKQFIDGVQIKLNDNEEFNGLWFQPGFEISYLIVRLQGLSLRFNYQLGPSFKVGDQGREKLSFLNHHFGIQFNLLNQTSKVRSNEE